MHPAPDKTALPDGSVVQVNHGGKIEPGFTPALRVVRLTEGEAHFTVAHDAARPFVVVAGDIAVRAVGTVFDVRRTETGTDVLVTEGKVQVECAGAAPTPVAAGEKLFLSLAGEPVGGARAVSSAEVERMLAWRSAMLEFDDVPLSAVIGEFNQRNAAQIIIGDVAAGKIPIGGQFRADNAEAFVRLLQRDFGVVVEARSDGAWVLRAAHGK